MKKPKHVNPKIFLHKVYAGAGLIATKLLRMLDKVEGRPIKALKERR